MSYEIVILPRDFNVLRHLPNRIFDLLKEEVSLVITSNDYFPNFYFAKTDFFDRTKVSNDFIYEKIKKNNYSFVVLYNCIFENNSFFLTNIFKLVGNKIPLLVNVVNLDYALINDNCNLGFSQIIHYPSWEKDDIKFFNFEKLKMYDKSSILQNKKLGIFSKTEIYKKEIHFYVLIKTIIKNPTDMNVFSLFLHDLITDEVKYNDEKFVHKSYVKSLLDWHQYSQIFRNRFKPNLDDEYFDKIQDLVRDILFTNMPLFEKIRDFFIENSVSFHQH